MQLYNYTKLVSPSILATLAVLPDANAAYKEDTILANSGIIVIYINMGFLIILVWAVITLGTVVKA